MVLADDLQERDPAVALIKQLVRRAMGFPEVPVSDVCIAGFTDWERVCRLLEAHGLLSLLGVSAGNLKGIVPTVLAARIQQYSLGNALRNRMLVEEYQAIAGEFQQAGVATIALKGISLLQRFPDYAGIRELGDIDYLVDVQQTETVSRIMRARGYRVIYGPEAILAGAPEYTSGQRRAYEQIYHEYTFVSADGLIFVDIHWRLTKWVYPNPLPVGLPTGELVDDAGSIAGVARMSRPYELVYVCMHAAKDSWRELKWAIDVAFLTREFTDADWRFAWELASRFRLRRILLTGIALTEWLTGEIQSGIRRYMEPHYWPSTHTLAQLCTSLIASPERESRRTFCLNLNKTYISLCDSNLDTFIYILRMFRYPSEREFYWLRPNPAILAIWCLFRPLAITAYCIVKTLRKLLLRSG